MYICIYVRFSFLLMKDFWSIPTRPHSRYISTGGWLVGQTVGRTVCWSDGRLVGRSVGRSVKGNTAAEFIEALASFP